MRCSPTCEALGLPRHVGWRDVLARPLDPGFAAAPAAARVPCIMWGGGGGGGAEERAWLRSGPGRARSTCTRPPIHSPVPSPTWKSCFFARFFLSLSELSLLPMKQKAKINRGVKATISLNTFQMMSGHVSTGSARPRGIWEKMLCRSHR
jgi:hypothetical protein